jgi:hypothetical protein
MVDAAGYTVPAGSVIAVTPSGSTESYAFQLSADLVIAAGQTVASGVDAQALIPGAAASGLTGTVTVIDQLAFVSQVALSQPTFGGVDEEADDAYLARLSALLTLLTPRPILPQDFAMLVAQEIEGVARAVAIDLYDPGPPVVTNEERCVTVAVCDPDGQPCSSQVKGDALTLLQNSREVNFKVFVIDPTYTQIDVSYDVQCYPGYDPADVQTRVTQAITDWLDPATWGLPPYGDSSGSSWINTPSVRYLELAQIVNSQAGVAYTITLTLCAHGGTLGTADVAMSGAAPLAQAGTISGAAQP